MGAEHIVTMMASTCALASQESVTLDDLDGEPWIDVTEGALDIEFLAFTRVDHVRGDLPPSLTDRKCQSAIEGLLTVQQGLGVITAYAEVVDSATSDEVVWRHVDGVPPSDVRLCCRRNDKPSGFDQLAELLRQDFVRHPPRSPQDSN